MTSPFEVTVYDKALRRRGWLGDPQEVKATIRHNALSVAEVTIDGDHPRVGDLMTPGARLVITYDGAHLISGPVVAFAGTGPAFTSALTVTVEDDWRVLQRCLGWPNPGGAIGQQGDESSYDRRTGPAETVVKGYAGAAFARLGVPVGVAADQGRGGRVSLQVRMHPLADRLFPAVDQAGIGVTVQQIDGAIVLDCYVPRSVPRELSEESGALIGWEWSSAAPQVTRVVVGGDGEGTARRFLEVVDAPLEGEWGLVHEEFRDARDVETERSTDGGDTVPVPEAEILEVMRGRALERITEGAAVTGLSLDLAEAEGLRYGRHLRVGDRVRVHVAPGVTVEDVVREARLTWTVGEGLTIDPVVGERSDDPDTILRQVVTDIARGLRALRTR